ncbi:MAG: hypothetical protein P4M14_12040 [Gammaproteobacteria bacterium]|nr:hypothetical protein [Gammaproteobacteria bacterium]
MNASHQTVLEPTGRMENGFAAPYDFSISEVFGEAWSKVKGFKTSVWGAVGWYFLIVFLLGILMSVVGSLFGVPATDGSAPNAMTIVLRVIVQILLYPMSAGIMMMGIKRAVNLPVRAKLVFRYYSAIWRILGVMLLSLAIAMIPSMIGGFIIGIMAATDYSLIVNIMLVVVGLAFILGGIYLAWSYLFVLQLTTEKRLGVWRSLQVSRKAICQHWWKVFFTTMIMFVIYILSVVFLLVGLIWSIPWLIATQGVLYRRIFGVEADLATNE